MSELIKILAVILVWFVGIFLYAYIQGKIYGAKIRRLYKQFYPNEESMFSDEIAEMEKMMLRIQEGNKCLKK